MGITGITTKRKKPEGPLQNKPIWAAALTEKPHRSRARSILAHTWLRSPPFSHLFTQTQTGTSKEPYGSIIAHNVGAPRDHRPSEGPTTFSTVRFSRVSWSEPSVKNSNI